VSCRQYSRPESRQSVNVVEESVVEQKRGPPGNEWMLLAWFLPAVVMMQAPRDGGGGQSEEREKESPQLWRDSAIKRCVSENSGLRNRTMQSRSGRSDLVYGLTRKM
jgi:hypothetical protein